MPEEILDKIPKSFKDVIEENKSIYYSVNIEEPLENQDLKPETIAILGMIYQDFLHNEFENYNFKESKNNDKLDYIDTKDNIKKEMKALIEVKETKWYNKILKIFNNIKDKLC